MKRLLAFLGIIVLIASAGPASARTWRVGRASNDCDGPCDYWDAQAGAGFGIQWGMNRPSTVAGDTVRVWPGVYAGAVVMKSDVALVSRHGASTTTLSGAAGNEPALFFVDTGPGTVVDGFTITWNSTTGGFGGGVAAYVSSGVVRNCVFRGCLASLGSAAYLQTCDMTMENNLIISNESTGGAGALAISGGSPTLRRNTLWQNFCPFGSQGASIYSTGASSILDRNIISTSQGGAAVYCGGTNQATITCNLFWDNPFGSFAGSCPDSVGLGGNFAADPLFCAPTSGNFGMCSDSPAVVGTCGPLGYTSPGGNCGPCLPTPVAQLETRSWAGLKALYRR